MDMYKLKFTRLQNEILRFLSIKVGETVNLRTIAKSLKVSPTAISKAIRTLEKEKLIIMKRQGKMNLISVEINRDNEKVLIYKRVENLSLIYESNLINFLEEKFPGTTIILFGSYSRGDDTIKSDIDIAIIKAKDRIIDLKDYEKKLERSIYTHFFKSLNNINKELKENILNGIILVGGIEL